MLEAAPRAAKFPHQAFALAPEAVAEAERLARRVAEEGALAASPAIGAWLSSAPPISHDRRTSLDPRIDGLVVRLRAAKLWEETAEKRDQAIAAWSAAPRDVWRTPERTAAHRVLRALRLIELDAPAIILEAELDGLAAAIAALDGPPPSVWSGPEEDPGPIVELRHAVPRHARHDLSFGTHTETFRALQTKKRFAEEPQHELSSGEPLVPFATLEARAKIAGDGERFVLDNLRFWKVAPASVLAEVATELADRLAEIPARARGKANRDLDVDEAADLRGGDYVVSAEARLREIAADAAEAEREGLQVVSEMSRDPAF